jgi:hypothetical protein
LKGGFIWRFATFVLVRNEAFVIARNESFVIARNEARMTWQSRSREPAFRYIFFARKFIDQKKNLSNAKKDAAAIRAMRLGFLRK